MPCLQKIRASADRKKSELMKRYGSYEDNLIDIFLEVVMRYHINSEHVCGYWLQMGGFYKEEHIFECLEWAFDTRNLNAIQDLEVKKDEPCPFTSLNEENKGNIKWSWSLWKGENPKIFCGKLLWSEEILVKVVGTETILKQLLRVLRPCESQSSHENALVRPAIISKSTSKRIESGSCEEEKLFCSDEAARDRAYREGALRQVLFGSKEGHDSEWISFTRSFQVANAFSGGGLLARVALVSLEGIEPHKVQNVSEKSHLNQLRTLAKGLCLDKALSAEELAKVSMRSKRSEEVLVYGQLLPIKTRVLQPLISCVIVWPRDAVDEAVRFWLDGPPPLPAAAGLQEFPDDLEPDGLIQVASPLGLSNDGLLWARFRGQRDDELFVVKRAKPNVEPGNLIPPRDMLMQLRVAWVAHTIRSLFADVDEPALPCRLFEYQACWEDFYEDSDAKQQLWVASILVFRLPGFCFSHSSSSPGGFALTGTSPLLNQDLVCNCLLGVEPTLDQAEPAPLAALVSHLRLLDRALGAPALERSKRPRHFYEADTVVDCLVAWLQQCSGSSEDVLRSLQRSLERLDAVRRRVQNLASLLDPARGEDQQCTYLQASSHFTFEGCLRDRIERLGELREYLKSAAEKSQDLVMLVREWKSNRNILKNRVAILFYEQVGDCQDNDNTVSFGQRCGFAEKLAQSFISRTELQIDANHVFLEPATEDLLKQAACDHEIVLICTSAKSDESKIVLNLEKNLEANTDDSTDSDNKWQSSLEIPIEVRNNSIDSSDSVKSRESVYLLENGDSILKILFVCTSVPPALCGFEKKSLKDGTFYILLVHGSDSLQERFILDFYFSLSMLALRQDVYELAFDNCRDIFQADQLQCTLFCPELRKVIAPSIHRRHASRSYSDVSVGFVDNLSMGIRFNKIISLLLNEIIENTTAQDNREFRQTGTNAGVREMPWSLIVDFGTFPDLSGTLTDSKDVKEGPKRIVVYGHDNWALEPVMYQLSRFCSYRNQLKFKKKPSMSTPKSSSYKDFLFRLEECTSVDDQDKQSKKFLVFGSRCENCWAIIDDTRNVSELDSSTEFFIDATRNNLNLIIFTKSKPPFHDVTILTTSDLKQDTAQRCLGFRSRFFSHNVSIFVDKREQAEDSEVQSDFLISMNSVLERLHANGEVPVTHAMHDLLRPLSLLPLSRIQALLEESRAQDCGQDLNIQWWQQQVFTLALDDQLQVALLHCALLPAGTLITEANFEWPKGLVHSSISASNFMTSTLTSIGCVGGFGAYSWWEECMITSLFPPASRPPLWAQDRGQDSISASPTKMSSRAQGLGAHCTHADHKTAVEIMKVLARRGFMLMSSECDEGVNSFVIPSQIHAFLVDRAQGLAILDPDFGNALRNRSLNFSGHILGNLVWQTKIPKSGSQDFFRHNKLWRWALERLIDQTDVFRPSACFAAVDLLWTVRKKLHIPFYENGENIRVEIVVWAQKLLVQMTSDESAMGRLAKVMCCYMHASAIFDQRRIDTFEGALRVCEKGKKYLTVVSTASEVMLPEFGRLETLASICFAEILVLSARIKSFKVASHVFHPHSSLQELKLAMNLLNANKPPGNRTSDPIIVKCQTHTSLSDSINASSAESIHAMMLAKDRLRTLARVHDARGKLYEMSFMNLGDACISLGSAVGVCDSIKYLVPEADILDASVIRRSGENSHNIRHNFAQVLLKLVQRGGDANNIISISKNLTELTRREAESLDLPFAKRNLLQLARANIITAITERMNLVSRANFFMTQKVCKSLQTQVHIDSLLQKLMVDISRPEPALLSEDVSDLLHRCRLRTLRLLRCEYSTTADRQNALHELLSWAKMSQMFQKVEVLSTVKGPPQYQMMATALARDLSGPELELLAEMIKTWYSLRRDAGAAAEFIFLECPVCLFLRHVAKQQSHDHSELDAVASRARGLAAYFGRGHRVLSDRHDVQAEARASLTAMCNAWDSFRSREGIQQGWPLLFDAELHLCRLIFVAGHGAERLIEDVYGVVKRACLGGEARSPKRLALIWEMITTHKEACSTSKVPNSLPPLGDLIPLDLPAELELEVLKVTQICKQPSMQPRAQAAAGLRGFIRRKLRHSGFGGGPAANCEVAQRRLFVAIESLTLGLPFAKRSQHPYGDYTFLHRKEIAGMLQLPTALANEKRELAAQVLLAEREFRQLMEVEGWMRLHPPQSAWKSCAVAREVEDGGHRIGGMAVKQGPQLASHDALAACLVEGVVFAVNKLLTATAAAAQAARSDFAAFGLGLRALRDRMRQASAAEITPPTRAVAAFAGDDVRLRIRALCAWAAIPCAARGAGETRAKRCGDEASWPDEAPPPAASTLLLDDPTRTIAMCCTDVRYGWAVPAAVPAGTRTEVIGCQSANSVHVTEEETLDAVELGPALGVCLLACALAEARKKDGRWSTGDLRERVLRVLLVWVCLGRPMISQAEDPRVELVNLVEAAQLAAQRFHLLTLQTDGGGDHL